MENKKFDVLISPTDVLEEELREVLGGGAQCNGQCNSLCNGQCSSNCKKTECNCKAQGQTALTPEDCPPGYIVIDNECVEAD